MREPYQLKPLGFVSAARLYAEDDCWGGEKATIRLAENHAEDALAGLESFSHVEVLFLFHQVGASRIVHGARYLRNNPNWPKIGTFAQRGKNRPNRIGATICRVESVVGRTLIVSELDAIDGTPVLDLTPVIREFLPRGEFIQPAWSHELMSTYWFIKPPDNPTS